MLSVSAVPTSALRAVEILPAVVGTVTTKTSLTDKANGGGKKKKKKSVLLDFSEFSLPHQGLL